MDVSTIAMAIVFAAKTAGVSPSLMLAICTHESNLKNVMVPHDGGSPSYGVCQIKEHTARQLGFRGKTKALMNPWINAKYSARYLARQHDRYDGHLCKAVAAYNSGTFNPSTKLPGKPRNWRYVKSIASHLEGEEKRQLLDCDCRIARSYP